MTDQEFDDLKAEIVKAWEEYKRLQREHEKQTGQEMRWFK